MFVVFRKRVLYDGIVFVGAKQYANGRVFKISFNGAVVKIDVHLQLAQILMGYLIHFNVKKDKTLQQAIVKNQVNAIIVTVNHDPFLTCHKGEAVQKSCSYC